MVFVGSGKRENVFFWKIFFNGLVFSKSLFSRCGETNQQLSQGALSCRRGCSAGCEDKFDSHEVQASAVAGRAGWCEDTFHDSFHASENPVVAGVAASSRCELDVAFAAARCGENNCNGHLLEFMNSLLAAESGCVVSTLLIRSFVIHPCMRLLLQVRCVLRVLEWLGWRGSVMVILGLHVGWALDGSLHDVVHSVSAYLDSRIESTLSVMVFHAVSCAPLLIRVWCVGLGFVE